MGFSGTAILGGLEAAGAAARPTEELSFRGNSAIFNKLSAEWFQRAIRRLPARLLL
jgi:hypothetical protein